MSDESKQVEEATEDLTDALCQAQEIFRRLNLGAGVPAEVELEPGCMLGFGKIRDEWLFTIKRTGPVSPTFKRDERLPLTSAPRRLRVMAASKLPELYEKNVEALGTTLKDIEEAIEKVEDFLDAHDKDESK